MENKLYVKDMREGRIYEVIEKMGEGWYRCYDLADMNYANNSTLYVEYNGDKPVDEVLIESNNLKDLVDFYMSDNGVIVGYVKINNKYGGHKYIPATFIDRFDNNKEKLVCLEKYY